MKAEIFLISGGWLLVTSVLIYSLSPTFQFSLETSYSGIARNYTNKTFSLTKNTTKELRTHIPLAQLRFHCSKQQGRTFHVITAANQNIKGVVEYSIGQADKPPETCGSFVRMKNDNSLLAGVCGSPKQIIRLPCFCERSLSLGDDSRGAQDGSVTTLLMTCPLSISVKSSFAKSR